MYLHNSFISDLILHFLINQHKPLVWQSTISFILICPWWIWTWISGSPSRHATNSDNLFKKLVTCMGMTKSCHIYMNLTKRKFLVSDKNMGLCLCIFPLKIVKILHLGSLTIWDPLLPRQNKSHKCWGFIVMPKDQNMDRTRYFIGLFYLSM